MTTHHHLNNLKYMDFLKQSGFLFKNYTPKNQSPFEKLFDVFKELITYTSGDFDEAIDWLKELDKEFVLTTDDYTMDDFIEDLLKKGYIKKDLDEKKGTGIGLTAKTEMLLRQHALKQIFGKMKRAGNGNHNSNQSGIGESDSGDLKSYEFGDSIEKISITESIKNAQIQSGINEFRLSKDDLVVNDQYHQAQMSTVLMIDISHSMILYGEDRITPAKKVAMALSEFITTRYPKDKLDIIVFGNDARPISIKELPYLRVGPYHTNTVAGLELAIDILRRSRNSNKQIFMITDGKPSCLKLRDGSYYKNSNGLDTHIVDKCYNMAQVARRLNIPITTFMIAQDPYLKRFVQEFTKTNNGKAFYTGLKGLGEMIFEDYEKNRKKRL